MAASDAYRGLLLSNLTAVKCGRINYQMSVPAQPGEITILSGTFAAVMAASFFTALREGGGFNAAICRTSYYLARAAARTSSSAALASRRALPSVSASLICVRATTAKERALRSRKTAETRWSSWRGISDMSVALRRILRRKVPQSTQYSVTSSTGQ